MRRPVEMKGAKHGLLRHALRSFVILCDHELRQAERIGQQDKFLALVVALLANARDELDSLKPFVLSELHLTRKRVEGRLREKARDSGSIRAAAGKRAAPRSAR